LVLEATTPSSLATMIAGLIVTPAPIWLATLANYDGVGGEIARA
jgi:hypothetical protein